MAVFPVVKGVRLRATKVNNCGLPVAGAANYVVTNGWISLTMSPVYIEADELDQRNAEGRICVAERTPPERKYYTVELSLCQVNTCLISMFTGWQQEVNYAGDGVGFRDKKQIESDFGVAIEIWTGGKSASDCPSPTNDDVFAAASSKEYGYFILFGTEWTMGDIEIGASVATFTLNGITFAGPQWGMGPWNVVPADAAGTPRRLITPIGTDQHYAVIRTTVPPPDPTPGESCCPLEISTLFVAPDYYFGGPAGEPAATVAPDQPCCYTSEVQQVAITGAPTGGTFTLTFEGQTTAGIAYNAAAAAVQSALEALSNIAPGDIAVTGGTLPGTPVVVTFIGPKACTNFAQMTANSSGLTGGTTPTVVVTTTQDGGQNP